MELKPNMYVRTQKGIFRISHINIDFDDNDYRKVCLTQNELVGFASVDEIKKLKPTNNIIDLIEVGDYVNGEKVEEIILDNKMSRIKTTECSTYFKEDIYSIVTREQFEQMQYKVGD